MKITIEYDQFRCPDATITVEENGGRTLQRTVPFKRLLHLVEDGLWLLGATEALEGSVPASEEGE